MNKVCHVIPFFYPQYAAPVEYTQKLAKNEFQVDVVALRRPQDPEFEKLKNLTITRVRIGAKRRFMGTAFMPLIRATQTLVEKNSYDIVHVYAFRGCFLLPLRGKSYTKHWILDIRSGNVSHSGLLSYIADAATMIESKAYTSFIALDERVGRKVLGDRAKFQVVSVGADMEKFQPGPKTELRSQFGLPQIGRIAVYIGSLDVRRRPQSLLRSFAATAKAHHDAILLIIGDDGALPELKALASELGIAGQVIFTGYVPYDQIQQYVACADIGVAYVPNTPEYIYQPPLKTAEYLACGLPTVATDTQGNAYFVEHEFNGLLAADDVDSYGKALLRLYEQPDFYGFLKKNARNSVLKHDWNRIVESSLIPYYEKLLALPMQDVKD